MDKTLRVERNDEDVQVSKISAALACLIRVWRERGGRWRFVHVSGRM